LNFPGRDNGEIAYSLDKHYGIMTRSGLHCAPSAHQTLGTFPHGTVRFSFNHFNTPQQIRYALDALNNLMKL
jgi:selenocysteine lyase/cysteine desulfurase